ncbi:hypothetical protein [Streptomyces virginiae]|uniref:hypothetical protein n=1 Tax=Streptomyces virginiae TaxID=1961 RepID=UPI0036F966C6
MVLYAASSYDVLQRMDFWQPMVARGAAVTSGPGMWTEHGWIVPRPDSTVPPAISLRRSKLDPLLREIAAATPGVDLMLGHRVVDLLQDHAGGVRGVVTANGEAARTGCRAPLRADRAGAGRHHRDG